MKKLALPLFAIILVIGGILYFLKTNYNPPPQTQESSSTSSTSSSTPSSESASVSTTVKTINVEAGSFYYKPNIITAKKGETIKIVMKSVSMMHDFNIDELGVKLPIIKNGDTGTVEFTASKMGTFEYYCSVGQHRANGQVGKLVVE